MISKDDKDGKINPDNYTAWEPNELNELTGEQIEQVLKELVKRVKKDKTNTYWTKVKPHAWELLLKKLDDDSNVTGKIKIPSRNFVKDRTFVNYDVPEDLANTWGPPEKSIAEEEKQKRKEVISRHPPGIPMEAANQKYLKYDNNKTSKWEKYGLPFLRCACGSMPYILESAGCMRESAWMIYCPKCRIYTDFYEYLDTARGIWNRHALYGEIHKDKKVEDYAKKTTCVSDFSKIRISKIEKIKNHLELFYYYDHEYLKKIKSLLSPGMRFKNYSDLCSYLSESDESQGAERNYHMKWWSRFFSFDRFGHKIVIREVFDDYKPYSGDPENPNKRRRKNFWRPRRYGDELYERSRHKPYKTDTDIEKIKKQAKTEVEKARNALYGIKYDRPEEEYEIYEEEDDMLDPEEMMEMYDLEGLVDDDDEEGDEEENEKRDDIMDI